MEKRRALMAYYAESIALAIADLQRETATLQAIMQEKQAANSAGWNLKYFRIDGRELTIPEAVHNIDIASEVLEKAQQNLERIRFAPDDEVEKTFNFYALVGIVAE